MLINVFGKWMNSDNITYIETNCLQTYVYFSGEYEGVEINNKTPDDVANEINKQIMLQTKPSTTLHDNQESTHPTFSLPTSNEPVEDDTWVYYQFTKE